MLDSWRLCRLGSRMTLDAKYVPIAPAKCCSLCLGQHVHKMSTCDIHNGCSGTNTPPRRIPFLLTWQFVDGMQCECVIGS